jgi:hypothetical protein
MAAVRDLASASVNIKVIGADSEVSGSGDANSKEILAELKRINDVLSKGQKLEQSGFMGQAAGGGIFKQLGKMLTSLLAPAVGGGVLAGAVIAGAGTIDNGLTKYTEAFIEGEDKIVEVNEKTRQIGKILTEQEAFAQGISTESGVVLDKYRANKQVVDAIGIKYGLHEGKIKLTSDQLDNIRTEHDKQYTINQRITAKEAERLSKLGGKSPIVAMKQVGTVVQYLDANDKVIGGADVQAGASLTAEAASRGPSPFLQNYEPPTKQTGAVDWKPMDLFEQQERSQWMSANSRSNDVSRNTSYISDVRTG